MRNLKRVLSLALAAMMLMGMMVVGASAADNYEDFTDKDEIVNSEAVATMVSLGVFNGKEDGSYFDPTGIVTRAEMAKIIAVSLNGGKDPLLGVGATSTQFSDVPASHWAASYIAYCANLGIINGKGDGTFGPDETVTGTAAAKMFLCALGYRSDLEGLTGNNWALNTDSLANKVGLYNDMTIVPSNGLTRDDTAQLTYNAVQAQEVEYRNLQGSYDGIVYPQDNGTMLRNRFGVVKVTGIVLANDVMSIDADTNGDPVAPAKEGWTRLNVTDVTGYAQANYNGLYGKQQYETVVSNDLVGQEVVLYVKYNNTLSPNASASTVMGQAIVTDKNTVVETAAKLKDTAAVKDALKGSGLTVGGTAIRFDENGRSNASNTGIVGTAGLKQRFIDNDNDGIVEYLIQELPALTKVKNVNSSAETVTFETLGSYDLEDVVCDETPVKDAYMLAISYDGDKLHVSNAPSVEGVVTAWNSSNSKITIDGTSYGIGLGKDLTSSATVNWANEVGSTYTLYLDNNGNFLGWKLVDASVGNLALVLKSGSDTGILGDKSGQVQVLLTDGTKATYDVNMIDSAKQLGADTSSTVNTDTLKANYTATALASNALKGKIISVTLDEDGVATIGYANVINKTNYKEDTTFKNQAFNKQTVKFGAGVADSNTVFFVGNENDGYSVLTGISSLSAKDKIATSSYSVTYQATAASTAVIKAIVLETSDSYATNATYAYISGDYVKISADTCQYDVVFEDGTTGTLTSKDFSKEAGTVVTYELDAKGLATFGTDNTFNGKVVTYVGAPAFSAENGDGTGSSVTPVLASNVTIWNVEDTDNIYTEDALAQDMSIAYIVDNDGYVVTVFVMDTNAAFADVTNTASATITGSVSKVAAGYSLEITGLKASTEKAVTYTYTVGSDTFTGYAKSNDAGTATITMPHNTTNGITITAVVK